MERHFFYFDTNILGSVFELWSDDAHAYSVFDVWCLSIASGEESQLRSIFTIDYNLFSRDGPGLVIIGYKIVDSSTWILTSIQPDILSTTRSPVHTYKCISKAVKRIQMTRFPKLHTAATLPNVTDRLWLQSASDVKTVSMSWRHHWKRYFASQIQQFQDTLQK